MKSVMARFSAGLRITRGRFLEDGRVLADGKLNQGIN